MKTSKDLYAQLEKVLLQNVKKSQGYQDNYNGKEEQHTFHGGWNLGYWEGRVSALEDILDIMGDMGMKPEIDIQQFLLTRSK
jgi:hypothetical protein